MSVYEAPPRERAVETKQDRALKEKPTSSRARYTDEEMLKLTFQRLVPLILVALTLLVAILLHLTKTVDAPLLSPVPMPDALPFWSIFVGLFFVFLAYIYIRVFMWDRRQLMTFGLTATDGKIERYRYLSTAIGFGLCVAIAYDWFHVAAVYYDR
jgi:hypothetical protein